MLLSGGLGRFYCHWCRGPLNDCCSNHSGTGMRKRKIERVSTQSDQRKGYKKTEVGWIPNDWEIESLNQLVVREAPICYGILKPGPHVESGVPVIKVTDYINGRINGGSLRRTAARIDAAYKRSKVLDGDLLLAIRGSVGALVVVPDQLKGANITQDTARLRIRDRSTREYLFHALRGRLLERQIKLNTIGQAVKGINIAEVRRLLVPIPPPPQQKKMAEILTTWNVAIEQTRKLVEAKKRHKKALLQQLLSGKLKPLELNHETWRARKLGELVVPVSRPVPKPENPYLSIGLRSHGKGTFQRFVEEPDKVMMDTLFRIEPEDLVVNITFAWEGAIAFATQKDSGGLVSHRFPTYRLKESEADRSFFSNLIQMKRFVWDLGLISPGGAGRNRVLDQKDF